LQLVTVVQDLEQMRARWPQRAETILNNHRAKIVGAGISCPTTLRHISWILGDEEIHQVSTSTTSGQMGRHSTTRSSTWRALAPANVLREGRPGTAVLIYDNLPPAMLELRPWYADPKLRRLATRAP
jgi:type IV secretory pathway TraG/TraD family ATPase VirD4